MRLQRTGRAAAREQKADARGTAEAERLRKHAERLAAASTSPRRPRVALEDQLVLQAPPAAHSYRLVLGADPKLGFADYAPSGGGVWSLFPFAPPNDLRLQEDRIYRVVWLDRNGRELPPSDIDPMPVLHFFLGPPDAPLSAEQLQIRQLGRTCATLRRQVQQLEEERTALRHRLLAQKKKARRRVRRLLKTSQAKQKATPTWLIPALAFAAGSLLRPFSLEDLPLASVRAEVTQFIEDIKNKLSDALGNVGMPQREARVEHAARKTVKPGASSTKEHGQTGPGRKAETRSEEPASEPTPASPASEPAPSPKPKRALSREDSLRLVRQLCEPDPRIVTDMNRLCSLEGPRIPKQLAYSLMTYSQPPLQDNQTEVSAWADLWDAHRVAAGLGRLAGEIRQAAVMKQTHKGYAVTPCAFTLAEAASTIRGEMQQVVEHVQSSGCIGADTLGNLRRIYDRVEDAVRAQIPAPDDVLGQAVTDCLDGFRRVVLHCSRQILPEQILRVESGASSPDSLSNDVGIDLANLGVAVPQPEPGISSSADSGQREAA